MTRSAGNAGLFAAMWRAQLRAADYSDRDCRALALSVAEVENRAWLRRVRPSLIAADSDIAVAA